MDRGDYFSVGIAGEGGEAFGSHFDFGLQGAFQHGDDFLVGFDGNGADIERCAGFSGDLVASCGALEGGGLDCWFTEHGVGSEFDILEFHDVTSEGENGVGFSGRVGIGGVTCGAFGDEFEEEEATLYSADLEFGGFANDDGFGVPVVFISEDGPRVFRAFAAGFFFGREEEGESGSGFVLNECGEHGGDAAFGVVAAEAEDLVADLGGVPGFAGPAVVGGDGVEVGVEEEFWRVAGLGDYVVADPGGGDAVLGEVGEDEVGDLGFVVADGGDGYEVSVEFEEFVCCHLCNSS